MSLSLSLYALASPATRLSGRGRLTRRARSRHSVSIAHHIAALESSLMTALLPGLIGQRLEGHHDCPGQVLIDSTPRSSSHGASTVHSIPGYCYQDVPTLMGLSP